VRKKEGKTAIKRREKKAGTPLFPEYNVKGFDS
jgi:hypothetical protein